MAIGSTEKIRSLGELLELASALRGQNKRIGLCDGHFNVIHPGHIRFLQFCKENSDHLIVAVHGFELLDPLTRDHYFSQSERGDGVATLASVDSVLLLDQPLKDLIKALRPHIYVKGQEFEDKQEQIREELRAVQDAGGKVLFGSGDINYASNRLVQRVVHQPNARLNSFLSTCSKYTISPSDLLTALNGFEKQKICVIGDTIVDQFIACDALGVSAEAPVLAIRELEAKEFIGGAAIVAQHVKALSAACHFISVIGDDEPGNWAAKNLNENGISTDLLKDSTRPTTFKIRYVVDNQKILRVSRLREHNISKRIEKALIERIQSVVPEMTGVIISDFVYGVITPGVLEAVIETAHRHDVKVFADVQCSSQVGDVSKFKNISLVTPTEREARIALADQSSGLEQIARNLLKKTDNENIMITLGPQGLLIYTQEKGVNVTDHSEYFCALENNPVDVAGAGDALLATASLSLASGLNVLTAGALGSCASAIAVSRVGNIPISIHELKNYLSNIQRYGEESRVEVIKPRSDHHLYWQGIF